MCNSKSYQNWASSHRVKVRLVDPVHTLAPAPALAGEGQLVDHTPENTVIYSTCKAQRRPGKVKVAELVEVWQLMWLMPVACFWRVSLTNATFKCSSLVLRYNLQTTMEQLFHRFHFSTPEVYLIVGN